MHGGGDVRPVGEKLNGKMLRQGGGRRRAHRLRADNSASGVRSLAHQPRDQILLKVQLRRDAGVALDGGLHFGARLGHAVGASIPV